MRMMILCGGLGTRLGVTTKVVNKHLLPLNEHPIVTQPLSLAVSAGFPEVLIVSNHESVSQFARLSEEDCPPYNCLKTYFTTQKVPRGIADAIRCGREFCDSGPVTVCLGDNFFSNTDLSAISQHIRNFKSGCDIWTKEVQDPRDYGVLQYDNGIPVAVVEKPQIPPTKLAVVGLYVFDERVWDVIDGLAPSKRGEFEVADVITWYLQRREVEHHMLRGPWHDLGRSAEAYFNIINVMREANDSGYIKM